VEVARQTPPEGSTVLSSASREALGAPESRGRGRGAQQGAFLWSYLPVLGFVARHERRERFQPPILLELQTKGVIDPRTHAFGETSSRSADHAAVLYASTAPEHDLSIVSGSPLFPLWTRAARDARFAALRRAQVSREAQLTAAERFAHADAMLEHALRFAATANGGASPTDETAECWRAIRATLAR
jgi:hypothetical protein